MQKNIKGCIQKKNAEKETLVHTGGRGVKKSHFLAHQKGDIFLWGGGKISKNNIERIESTLNHS